MAKGCNRPIAAGGVGQQPAKSGHPASTKGRTIHFGFSVRITRQQSGITYDGKHLACLDIVEDVTGFDIVAALIKRSHQTKPAKLLVDFCKEHLGYIDESA